MTEAAEPAVEVISRLVPAVLKGLYALEFAGRHIAPHTLQQLSEAIGGRDGAIEAALQESRALDWPERLAPARDCLERAAEAAHEGLTGLLSANDEAQPMLAAYRALRNYARACEALYPMATHLRPVSQFFLEPAVRQDQTRLAELAAIDPLKPDVGLLHVGGPAGTRGAFSLYVPEYYESSRAWPLVVAMHGGSGNGGAFLWSWMREARTRGLIVLSPTALGSTWSLMEPDADGANIDRMVAGIGERWNLDPARKLLTGMSDGGTMTYVLGLRTGCQFTHLAPIAAAFHPMLLSMMADPERVRGLPIHIVHGAHDWMFPAQTAKTAEKVLAQAGADVVFRCIDDLAHTYPRDENGAILDWFDSPPHSDGKVAR
ncbi:MAG TPA: dienelactone hydrolase family protein [Reyranella sp.]|nr:dienelactone hydrolase family protein [Reyranella sp.]